MAGQQGVHPPAADAPDDPVHPGRVRRPGGGAAHVFTFPNDLGVVVNGMGKFAALLAVAFVAGCVGQESRRGAWKMLLPRRDGRSSFLAAKVLVCLVAAGLWAALVIASGLVTATVYGSLLGVGSWSHEGELSIVLARLAAVGLTLLAYGATAFLAAVLLRSSYSAMFFAFIALKVLDFQAPAGAAAMFVPAAQLRNFEARLTGFPDVLGCDAFESLIAVVVYAAACFAVACCVFRFQEFSGNTG